MALILFWINNVQLTNQLRFDWVIGPIVVAWLFFTAAAHAQPAFAPPPPPAAPQSAVRGIYNPNAAAPSPAAVLAPPRAQPTTTPNVEAAPTTPSTALPIEGGEIVARIDGQIVLASEVLWQVQQILKANQDRIPPDQVTQARRVLLRQQVMSLVDTKLLYADFLRTVPAENLPSIKKNLAKPFEASEVPRLIKMLEVEDRGALVELLESYGTSLDDVQRQFGERTIAGEWLRQRVPKPKQVTHEQMLTYYKEHAAEYEFEAKAKWEELMVRFERHNGDRATAWRTIAEMGNEIWQHVASNPNLRGPIFEEIAKEKSEGFTAQAGGQHDWTTLGALRSEKINEALFRLQVGQLSNIIESDLGFHIVRVLERHDAGRTPFTEAQAGIRDTLEKAQRPKLVEKEMIAIRQKSRVWTVFDGDLSGPQISEMLKRRQQRR